MTDEAKHIKQCKFKPIQRCEISKRQYRRRGSVSDAMFAETAFGGAPIKGEARFFILLQTSVFRYVRSALTPAFKARRAALLFKILILVNLLARLNTEYRSVIF